MIKFSTISSPTTRVTLLALLVMTTAACSTPVLQTSADRKLEQDLRSVQQTVLELQRQAAVSEVEISRLREQVARLEGARSEADAIERRMPEVRAEPAAEGVESSPPPLARRDQAPGSRSLPDEAPSVPDRATGAAVEISAAGQALYDRGYNHYHEGRYVEAEASFQRFLIGFSESDLADNAKYWIGESRYARQDLEGALLAFDEAILNYPQGNKIPAVLLKSAICLEKLRRTDEAKERYQSITERFPGTVQADQARKALAGY